ncbi:homeobox protein EgHBX4, partial [Circinella umbellata]
KRTHLKPSQLTILQNSFSVNPLPDASVRSQLAQDLNVSERTIQIWFQNRRAKARKLEALSNS